MRDFTKKYFHLNSSAVYNSSAKKEKYENFFTITKTPNRKVLMYIALS